MKSRDRGAFPYSARGYAPTPTISGQVVDAETGAAIPQAHVFVVIKGRSVAQALSDRTGRFAIGGLDADVQYEMDAAAGPLMPRWVNSMLSVKDCLPILIDTGWETPARGLK